ncbi:MAG: hypothetical protein IJW45_01595 [Oscillospiraceae bacterium]|nr:hypothetical protein [Oscillospiraceae bacterium]
MKTVTIRHTNIPCKVPRYPNAADRRYHLRKLVDGLLVFATATGAFVALTFLLLL